MGTPADEALARAEALQARVAELRRTLEQTTDPERAVELMTEAAQIAKDVEAELERARREADA